MKSLAFALALLASTAAIAAPAPFEPLDLYRLSMVTDPKVSPDGQRIAFTRTLFDIQTDSRQGEVWLATIAGKAVDKRLLIGAGSKASGVAWSPDGKRIAYVGPWLGKPQLWVMDVDLGVGRVVTTGKIAPENLVWSPDGSRIAFSGRAETPAPAIPGMPKKPEGATWAADAKVISSFRYRGDAAGYTPAGNQQLYVAAVDGGTPPEALT